MSRAGATRAVALLIVLLLTGGLLLVIAPASWREAVVGGNAPSPAALGTPTRTATPTPTPTPTTAPPVLDAVADTAAATAAGVAAAVSELLADPDLGSEQGVAVAAESGALLLDVDSQTPRTPASTTKILTAVAALGVLGPDTRFVTSVELPAPGQIVLVGGGDPSLSQRVPGDADWPYAITSLEALAQDTAQALRQAGTTGVTLGYRADLFVGPDVLPAWAERGYVPAGQVAPVSALAVDGGREQPGEPARALDPAAYTARLFAQLLTESGIAVQGGPVAADAALTGPQIATVTSPTVADLAAQMLVRSDNDAAEVLARHVARAMGEEASFAGVARALPAALQQLGIPVPGLLLDDGSGLSRRSLVAPATLVAALQLAFSAEHDQLRAVLVGLPVAGFTGTLAERFSDEQSARQVGDIRAKTGYLSGVVALAGYVVDEEGEPLLFAVMSDAVPNDSTLDAQETTDRIAAALAGCGCG